MQLRLFRPSDLPQVYELACSSLNESYNPTLFLDLYSYWPEGFIVMENEGLIIGFIFGVMLSRIDARILMLAVHEKYRRRGAGTILFHEFLKQCSLKGIRTITLEVRVSNFSAIDFYKKLGFQINGRVSKYYSNGEDAYRMQLYL